MKKHIKYLANKHQGGISNSVGNLYENHFAVFKIISHFDKSKAFLNKIVFVNQKSGCFIDDLFIRNGNRKEYHQLKTTKSLYWGVKKKKGTLNFDFSNQLLIEKRFKQPFILILVVQSKKLQTSLLKNRPKKLKSVTAVDHFPVCNNILEQVTKNPGFKAALEQICGLTGPQIDKLEALAKTIQASWSNKQTNTRIVLENIYNEVLNTGYSYLKPRVVKKMNKKLIGILKQIPKFTFNSTKGYLEWTYSVNDSGVVPNYIGGKQFKIKQKAIIKQNPKTFQDLEPFLY